MFAKNVETVSSAPQSDRQVGKYIGIHDCFSRFYVTIHKGVVGMIY